MAKVVTLFPGFGFKLFDTGLNSSVISNGIEFHLERKRRKYINSNPNPIILKIYERFSALYFSLIYLKFRYYLSRSKPAVICIWNGHRLPEMAIKAAAQGLNIKIAYFENGLLPNTTTMDFSGVNASCSLPKDPQFYLDYYSDLTDFDLVDIDKKLVVRKPHKKRSSLIFQDFDLSKAYFFVPFQVNFDSQVIINSPRVNSMEAFYSLLEDAIEIMGENSPVFLIKEHPSDARTYPELHSKNSNIIFVNNNTEELIKHACAVITLNSSVGIEAALLAKKVIVLGDACFSVDGLVNICRTKDEFINCLKQIDSTEAIVGIRVAFFTYLLKEYLLPGAWQDMQNTTDLNHIRKFEEKVNLEALN
jgi:capsular polysaccharide export protein